MKVCPNDDCPHLLSNPKRAEYADGDHCPECHTVLLDVGTSPVGAEIGGPLGLNVPSWVAHRLLWYIVGVLVLVLGLAYDAATSSSELVIANGTDVILHVDAEDADHHHERFVVPLGRFNRMEVAGDLTIEVVDGHGNAVGEFEFENPGAGISVINPGRGRPLCRIERGYDNGNVERALTESTQTPLEGDILHFETGTRVFRRPLDGPQVPGTPAATIISFCR